MLVSKIPKISRTVKSLVTYLLFFIAAVFSTAYGQPTPGFLVTQQGDTLRGDIVYEKNQFFIKTNVGIVDSLHSRNLAAVYYKKYKGRVYYGAVCQYDNDINPVREKADDKCIDTCLVLKTIYRDNQMTLLEGVDNYKRIYFFVEKKGGDRPIQMMVSYRLITVINASVANLDANVKHIQIKSYVAQLKNMMADCKHLNSYDWESMDYRSYSFKAVLKWYAKCK